MSLPEDARPAAGPPDTAGQERLLNHGALAIVGRVVDSSNATFVVEVTEPDAYAWAIYKPESGERPLWDFEPGLFRRERAAHLLDRALGWGLVPSTVIRDDAPLGIGSLQWFVEFEPSAHYFTLLRDAPETHAALRRMAVFDLLANNTDRKGGHVLRDQDGRVWAIDHGLRFAAEFKLRTVIWDFTGDPIEPSVLESFAPLADEVPAEVAELLTDREVRALRSRARRLLDSGILPADPTGRAWPWPLI